jgi:hypothetical protein
MVVNIGMDGIVVLGFVAKCVLMRLITIEGVVVVV